jgi:rhodanese-related sulfurtransferase
VVKRGYYGVILALVVLLSAAPGCAGEVRPATSGEPWVKEVASQEAFKLIQGNQGKPDFIILDVRTPEEFAEGHIAGALNISTRQLTFNEEIKKLNRNYTYLVYCRTGSRSIEAVNTMGELGFKRIYHMVNGITEWTAAGLPVVK